MSTRSFICKRTEDGKLLGIYCHYDGYLEHHGRILCEYYNTPEKVDALIALGDLSSLGKKISPTNATHDIDHPEPGVCIAYGRDAHCEDTGAQIFKSKKVLIENLNHNPMIEYIYLWEDNRWKYAKGVAYIDEFPNRRLTAKSFKSLKSEVNKLKYGDIEE